MDKSDFVTLFVAVLSLLAALASQRQSAKTSKGNNSTDITTTTISSKTQAETEAFVRAKAFYTEIIERQDKEIVEFRAEVTLVKGRCETLEVKCDDLEDQNQSLRLRIIDLEKN